MPRWAMAKKQRFGTTDLTIRRRNVARNWLRTKFRDFDSRNSFVSRKMRRSSPGEEFRNVTVSVGSFNNFYVPANKNAPSKWL